MGMAQQTTRGVARPFVAMVSSGGWARDEDEVEAEADEEEVQELDP